MCVISNNQTKCKQNWYIYIYIVTARQEYHWGMQGGTLSVSRKATNNVNVVPQFISPMNIAIVDQKDLHAGHVKSCDDKLLV